MKQKPKEDCLVRLDHTAAMRYIHDNFDISGEAGRMCAGLFDFAGKNGGIARSLILDVLDGIGFTENDMADMTKQDIFRWR